VNPAAISAGDYHSLACTSDGTAWAWGSIGQLCGGTNTKTPTQVVGMDNVALIAAGSSYSLFAGTSVETGPPQVAGTWPAADATEHVVTHIVVTFTEPVTNVTADDLILSTGSVTSVSGSGPYVVEVTGATGTVTATLDGDIVDTPGNDLAAYQWQFTVPANLPPTILGLLRALRRTPARSRFLIWSAPTFRPGRR